MACARFARPMGVFWRRSHWAKVARVWSSTSRRMADLRPCIVPSSRVWDRSYGRSVCTCPVFPPLFNGGLYLEADDRHSLVRHSALVALVSLVGFEVGTAVARGWHMGGLANATFSGLFALGIAASAVAVGI